MQHGARLETSGWRSSGPEAWPELANTSARFRSAFSDLLIAHIDDVVRLEDEIKVLREQTSNINCDLNPRGSELNLRLGPSDAAQAADSAVLIRNSYDMTYAERETMAREDALKAAQDHRRFSLSQGIKKIPKKRPMGESVSETAVPWCTRMVDHSAFEIFFGFLILSNSVFMSAYTDYEAAHAGEPFLPWPLYAVRYCYAVLFTVELLMRAYAKGIGKFLMGRSLFWNYLDLGVVMASWLEIVTDMLLFVSVDTTSVSGVNLSNTRAFRILRVARLVRVLHIGKLLSFLRPLQVLVFSTLHTMKTVIWALLLLLIIIYVFGMVFCQAVIDHRKKTKGHALDAGIDLYWGSLPRCMFTLFKAVAGGLSWHECVYHLGTLSNVPWLWIFVFIVYISCTTFAVMNVITGVFCQSAIEGIQVDRDIVTQKHMAIKQVYVNTIREVFKDIVIEGDDQITLDEFEAHFRDERARALFSSLEIEATSAFEIFQLIDGEGGALDIDEFVNGCLRLRGNARSLEIAKLEKMARNLDKKIVKILKVLHEVREFECFASIGSSHLLASFGEPVRLPLADDQGCAASANHQPKLCTI